MKAVQLLQDPIGVLIPGPVQHVTVWAHWGWILLEGADVSFFALPANPRFQNHQLEWGFHTNLSPLASVGWTLVAYSRTCMQWLEIPMSVLRFPWLCKSQWDWLLSHLGLHWTCEAHSCSKRVVQIGQGSCSASFANKWTMAGWKRMDGIDGMENGAKTGWYTTAHQRVRFDGHVSWRCKMFWAIWYPVCRPKASSCDWIQSDVIASFVHSSNMAIEPRKYPISKCR